MPVKTHNSFELLGVVGAEPEVVNLTGGKTKAKVSVGVRWGTKQPDGSYVDKTDWHTVIAWHKEAEILAEHAKVGDDIFVQGYIANNVFKDKNGNDVRLKDLVARKVIVMSRNGASHSSDEKSPQQRQDSYENENQDQERTPDPVMPF